MVLGEKSREVESFGVGDYVTLNDPNCAGVVYRVDDVIRDDEFPNSAFLNNYKLRPVYGAFGAAERRGNRLVRPGQMARVDIVRAGIEHMKMLDFIRDLARHYGIELPSGTE